MVAYLRPLVLCMSLHSSHLAWGLLCDDMHETYDRRKASMFLNVYKSNIYIEECIFRLQVIIQASFVKGDGSLFIIFNLIFWRLCNFSSVGI